VSLYKTDAVVLKTHNLSEADRIFILFSPLYGRIDAVARGIRKPSSKFGGTLEIFSHVYLMLSEGKNLAVITQAELCNSHYSLREDLRRLACASYFIEIVTDSILPGQENIELFSLVLSGLSLLEYHDNLDLILRYTEIHFLKSLGVNPILERCLRCGNLFTSSYVKFFTTLGGAFCEKCIFPQGKEYFTVSLKTLNFLHSLLKVLPGDLEKISFSTGINNESRCLLRSLIICNLGKDIKSLKMLDSFMEAL